MESKNWADLTPKWEGLVKLKAGKKRLINIRPYRALHGDCKNSAMHLLQKFHPTKTGPNLFIVSKIVQTNVQ